MTDKSNVINTLDEMIVAASGRRIKPNLNRVEVAGYGEVMARKDRLPAALPDISSLRDFGGCYLVHGRYLLHATRARRLAYACMVDTNVLPEFVAAADAVKADIPGTEVEWVQADFRNPAMYSGLKVTDAALLYEVILHQENYIEVLRNVCGKTRRFICIAQPCLREEFFSLPAGAVMLQFWDEPLKDLLRQGSFWPKEARVERFTTAHWMWGQTTSHLIAVMQGFGWRLREGEIIDNVCGPAWEYPMLVFEQE